MGLFKVSAPPQAVAHVRLSGSTTRRRPNRTRMTQETVRTLRGSIQQLDEQGRLHVCTELVGCSLVAQQLPDLHQELQR